MLFSVLGAKSAIDVIKSNDDDKYEMKWENVFFQIWLRSLGQFARGQGWVGKHCCGGVLELNALFLVKLKFIALNLTCIRFAWTRVFPTFNSHGKLVLILP